MQISILHFFVFLIYPVPHFIISIIIGMKLIPISVKEYSTLGGTSLYTFLFTSLSRSSSLNCCVSTPLEMVVINFWSSLKRIVLLWRAHKIGNFHFPINTFWAKDTGQNLILSFTLNPYPFTIVYIIWLCNINMRTCNIKHMLISLYL